MQDGNCYLWRHANGSCCAEFDFVNRIGGRGGHSDVLVLKCPFCLELCRLRDNGQLGSNLDLHLQQKSSCTKRYREWQRALWSLSGAPVRFTATSVIPTNVPHNAPEQIDLNFDYESDLNDSGPPSPA
jgi:hypothetical protein